MKKTRTNSMGMLVDKWNYKSCEATIGVGKDWATVYSINSNEQGKGHATKLLIEVKKHYESKGKKFGSSIALSPAMKHLLQKLNIYEYTSFEHGCVNCDEADYISMQLDEPEFNPCSKCDGHPACEDFGCAYELGLGRMVKKDIPKGSDDWG